MFGSYICFTTLPQISDLLCIFAAVHKDEKIKISLYNHTILKCRQLIFENRDVIACPNLDGTYGIYIIVKESYYHTGKLQEYLKKHKLKTDSPVVVTRHLYEGCCFYTVLAKLAPKWNILSNYFVKGRNFLVSTSPTDCVHLSIFINSKGATTFTFKLGRLKLPTMSIEKLDLPEKYRQEFKLDGRVRFKQQDYISIRVLPSLKQGYIVSVSKDLQNSTFSDYQQMKRHWKNTYGYRLPEGDAGLLYMQVSFFDGSPVFTYPSVCVRPYEPIFLQRVEPGAIIANFMTDLLKTIPDILGDRYPVPSHMSNPTLGLSYVTQDTPYPNTCDINTTPSSDSCRKDLSATQNSAFLVLSNQKSVKSHEGKQEVMKSALSQLIEELHKNKDTSSSPTSENNSQSKTHTGVKDHETPYKPTFSKHMNKIAQGTKLQPKPHTPKRTSSILEKNIKNQKQFLSNSITLRQNPPKTDTSANGSPDPPNSSKLAPKFAPKFAKHNLNPSGKGIGIKQNLHMTTKPIINKNPSPGKENQFVSQNYNNKFIHLLSNSNTLHQSPPKTDTSANGSPASPNSSKLAPKFAPKFAKPNLNLPGKGIGIKQNLHMTTKQIINKNSSPGKENQFVSQNNNKFIHLLSNSNTLHPSPPKTDTSANGSPASPNSSKLAPKFAPKFAKANLNPSGKRVGIEQNLHMATKQIINKNSSPGKENQFVSQNINKFIFKPKFQSNAAALKPKSNVELKALPVKNSPNKQEPPGVGTEKAQVKRHCEDKKSIEPPATKKVKTKPVTQEIQDMEDRVRNNTVEKLTVPTLMNWLKSKSVRCTTKDKKSELISKIKDVLCLQNN